MTTWRRAHRSLALDGGRPESSGRFDLCCRPRWSSPDRMFSAGGIGGRPALLVGSARVRREGSLWKFPEAPLGLGGAGRERVGGLTRDGLTCRVAGGLILGPAGPKFSNVCATRQRREKGGDFEAHPIPGALRGGRESEMNRKRCRVTQVHRNPPFSSSTLVPGNCGPPTKICAGEPRTPHGRFVPGSCAPPTNGLRRIIKSFFFFNFMSNNREFFFSIFFLFEILKKMTSRQIHDISRYFVKMNYMFISY